ncbi:hypothetical protein ACRAWF_45850 [Streptomyces sp. L7]
MPSEARPWLPRRSSFTITVGRRSLDDRLGFPVGPQPVGCPPAHRHLSRQDVCFMTSNPTRPTHHGPLRSYVVIGDTHLAGRVCSALHTSSDAVRHLPRPRDPELRAALALRPAGVAVLLHDDVAALRYALAVAHVAPDVPLLVTIFDRTIADELAPPPSAVRCHLAGRPRGTVAGRPLSGSFLRRRSPARRVCPGSPRT